LSFGLYPSGQRESKDPEARSALLNFKSTKNGALLILK